MKIYPNIKHKCIMSLCIVNAVVEKSRQLQKEIEKNWGILRANTLHILKDTQFVGGNENSRRNGKRTYQNLVREGRRGTGASRGTKNTEGNCGESGIQSLGKTTPIGKVVLTKKYAESGVPANIGTSKDLYKNATKFVFFAVQIKDFTLTILSRLLITPNFVMNQATHDFCALNVTKKQLILEVGQGRTNKL